MEDTYNILGEDLGRTNIRVIGFNSMNNFQTYANTI